MVFILTDVENNVKHSGDLKSLLEFSDTTEAGAWFLQPYLNLQQFYMFDYNTGLFYNEGRRWYKEPQPLTRIPFNVVIEKELVALPLPYNF